MVDAGTGAPAPDCGGWANEWCQQLSACDPRELLTTWGDVATCRERAALACTLDAAAPGSGMTASAVAACADAVRASSCPDFRVRAPEACRYRGNRPVNSPCLLDSQCAAGTSCYWPAGASCGVCTAETRGSVGDYCHTNEGCGPGLTCLTALALPVCARLGALGESCEYLTHPCRSELTCDQGTCKPAGLAGEACAGGDTACDWHRGLGCDPQTVRCTALPIAARGYACGSGLSPEVLCGGGSRCSSPATGGIGSCLGPEVDGAACGSSACLAPAFCSAALTCALTDSTKFCQ